MILEIDLEKVPLFKNIPNQKIFSLLENLNASKKDFKKNETIFRIGTNICAIGIVIYGSVNIESYNYNGQKIIIGRAEAGEIFAETYAFTPSEPLMVNVVAAEKTQIVFLDTKKLLEVRTKTSSTYIVLINNLLTIFAQKNLHLSHRMMLTTPRTIRERILLFLAEQSKKVHSKKFEIPFDRQQLADYLNVDRSALSHELSKLQNEGLLTVHKNFFTLS